MADIDKSSIQSRHQLTNPSYEDVSDRKICFCPLLMDFDKSLVIKHRDLDICRARTYDQLFIHDARLFGERKTAFKGGPSPLAQTPECSPGSFQ
jgi:hypothetical protein